MPQKLPFSAQRIYGSIVKIENRTAYFQLHQGLNYFVYKTKVKPENEVYFVRFMNNRVSIALENNALDCLNTNKICKYIFPVNDDSIRSTRDPLIESERIDWISDVNAEQRNAIRYILHGSSRPYPYILFGPPGTGKTKTLVETVSQLIARNQRSERILVCATSNSACDEIAKRLLDLNDNEKIFRLFSRSVMFKMENVPGIVLMNSNLAKGEHYFPTRDVIYAYKVLVCTLITAGRMTQGEISSEHFSHVFIDEAGSTTETQTLVAIAGLCSSSGRINANVTLAGDPKQLGPVIHSDMATKLGLGWCHFPKMCPFRFASFISV